jgi:hypothetical protein
MNAFHERILLTKPPFPVIHIQIIVAVFMAQIILVVGYKRAEIQRLKGIPCIQ